MSVIKSGFAILKKIDEVLEAYGRHRLRVENLGVEVKSFERKPKEQKQYEER